MRAFFTTTLIFICCVFNTTFAQKDIKQIIYDDLLALNDLYNGRIIQPEQLVLIIKENDTIKQRNTLLTLKDSSESLVSIVKIDSASGAYFVEVKFHLVPCAAYSYLFLDYNFKYILYKRYGKYYKIDGFLVSDILLLVPKILFIGNELKDLKNAIKMNNISLCKFKRYLMKRETTKIQNYLSISVIKEMKNLGFYFCDKPYVKDRIGY